MPNQNLVLNDGDQVGANKLNMTALATLETSLPGTEIMQRGYARKAGDVSSASLVASTLTVVCAMVDAGPYTLILRCPVTGDWASSIVMTDESYEVT